MSGYNEGICVLKEVAVISPSYFYSLIVKGNNDDINGCGVFVFWKEVAQSNFMCILLQYVTLGKKTFEDQTVKGNDYYDINGSGGFAFWKEVAQIYFLCTFLQFDCKR